MRGRYLARRKLKTEYGEADIAEVLLEDSGDIVSFFMPMALKQHFDFGYQRGPIPVGFDVCVKFLGEKPSKRRKGKNFKDFHVQFRKPLFEDAETIKPEAGEPETDTAEEQPFE